MDLFSERGHVMRKAVWGTALRVLVALPAIALSGCGDLTRQGTGSSYLIVQSLEAASGAEPNEFSGTLDSDVLTFVDGVATIFNDVGRVRLALGMKDAGGAESPTTPSSANFITVNRYNVRYFRADGRNTPGVDVPSGFDGAFTATVGTTSPEVGFELVRHIAKEQAPLRALARNSAVIISTIGEITFYGRDQTGREVSVSARILINFGDFGDPN
jgi:hypothetical protein